MKKLVLHNFINILNDIFVDVINENECFISDDFEVTIDRLFIKQAVMAFNKQLDKLQNVQRIIIQSCDPMNNWRNTCYEELFHYLPTEFGVNQHQFNILCNEMWKKAEKRKDIIDISQPSLDYYDILTIIKEHVLEVLIEEVPPLYDVILTDGNDYFQTRGPIKAKYKTNLEIELATAGLIFI